MQQNPIVTFFRGLCEKVPGKHNIWGKGEYIPNIAFSISTLQAKMSATSLNVFRD